MLESRPRNSTLPIVLEMSAVRNNKSKHFPPCTVIAISKRMRRMFECFNDRWIMRPRGCAVRIIETSGDLCHYIVSMLILSYPVGMDILSPRGICGIKAGVECGLYPISPFLPFLSLPSTPSPRPPCPSLILTVL